MTTADANNEMQAAFPISSEDPKLAEIVRRLVAALRPRRIYLFGSRARGDHRVDSDYDVLAIVDTTPDRCHDLTVLGYGAMWGVGASVDIVVMTPEYFDSRLKLRASFPSTVNREGAVLYAA